MIDPRGELTEYKSRWPRRDVSGGSSFPPLSRVNAYSPVPGHEKYSRPNGQLVFCINTKLFLNLDNSDTPLVGD